MAFNILGPSRFLLVRACVLLTAIFGVASMRHTNTETEHLDAGASNSDFDRTQQNSASYYSQWHEMFGQWLEETEMEGLVKEVKNAKTKGASDRQIQAAFCFAESGYHTFEEFGLQPEHIKNFHVGDIPKKIFLDGIVILQNLNEMRWTKRSEKILIEPKPHGQVFAKQQLDADSVIAEYILPFLIILDSTQRSEVLKLMKKLDQNSISLSNIVTPFISVDRHNENVHTILGNKMASTFDELRARFNQIKKRQLSEGTKDDWQNKKYTAKANEFSGKFAKEQIIDGAKENIEFGKKIGDFLRLGKVGRGVGGTLSGILTMPGHLVLYCSASAALYSGLVGGAFLVDTGNKFFHKTEEDEEFIELRQKLVEELMHQLKTAHNLHGGNVGGKQKPHSPRHALVDEKIGTPKHHTLSPRAETKNKHRVDKKDPMTTPLLLNR